MALLSLKVWRETNSRSSWEREAVWLLLNIYSQYRNEMHKRAENMVPQLDGTNNVSDDSDTDSHSYLDLASSSIIAHRTRGQKQRHEINTRANIS